MRGSLSEQRTSQRRVGGAWQEAETPRGCLWIVTHKMGEKLVVIQVPASTGVVGHDVGFPRNVVVRRGVAMAALVERVEAEEVRARRSGCRRSLGGPRQGGLVVGGRPEGALGDGVVPGEDVFVSDECSQLQIGDGDGAVGPVTCHKSGVHGRWESLAPQDGSIPRRGRTGKPNAAHADAARVAGAEETGLHGHKLPYPSRARVQGVSDGSKVRRHMPYLPGDADAIAIRSAQGLLEYGEEASGAREGGGHGTEFSQQLVPSLHRHAFVGRADGVE